MAKVIQSNIVLHRNEEDSNLCPYELLTLAFESSSLRVIPLAFFVICGIGDVKSISFWEDVKLGAILFSGAFSSIILSIFSSYCAESSTHASDLVS